MNLPDWLFDEIIGPSDPNIGRLLLALFRHGSPQVAGDGSRRVYWRGTKAELARISYQSKRSADAAVLVLAARGVLNVHTVSVARAGVAFSVPLERQRGATVAPLAEPETKCIHGGGDLQISPCLDNSLELPTTTMTREEIFAALAEHGVTNPAAWLERYDHGRIEGALYRLEETDARDRAKIRGYGAEPDYSIKNPAGFLYRLLESKNALPDRFDPAPREDSRAGVTPR